MEVELTWMELWNGAVEGQFLFKELRGISRAWRSGQKTLDMWANCVLKHCLSLKTFIPNFVGFFRNCKILHSRDVVLGHFGKTRVYAGHCFIIHLPGGGQCPLARDGEPMRLLEIQTSPSLYMLIAYSWSDLPGTTAKCIMCRELKCQTSFLYSLPVFFQLLYPDLIPHFVSF